MTKPDCWNQEKVVKWLNDKGWGQFASTFEKHNICHEKFLNISLAELVEYLPRSMTTYYERRRLLNEIRALNNNDSSDHPSAPLPIHISINTNMHDYRPNISPYSHSSDHIKGYSSSPSPSPSPSPSSDHLVATPFSTTNRKNYTSYSPKAAFNKFKNPFRSTTTTAQNSASSLNGPTPSPRSVRHESGDEGNKRTPDKISKFWSNYWHHSPKKQPNQQPKEQRIQVTGDKETWYSLNVTNIRDPVTIKQLVLNRMNYEGHLDDYLYFHENGPNPNLPIEPHELMDLCSTADQSASQRLLVRPILKSPFSFSTPELGQSPTTESSKSMNSSPKHYTLCRKGATKMQRSSFGVQLSDPPTPLEERSKTSIVSLPLPSPSKLSCSSDDPPRQHILWAVPPANSGERYHQSHPSTPDLSKSSRQSSCSNTSDSAKEFWGERPPTEVVFDNMERYFDKQDLDKEVEVAVDATNSLSRRSTKSIRLVAREASRKYKKTGETMVRRKSTKLWGQRLVEVKSKSAHVMTRLPSVSEHMSLSHANTSDTPIQWIRGKLIGKGSFGKVYLAFNVGSSEVIAVKQVEVPKTVSDMLNERQHDVVEALYQEIMMLRDLDHENIVQYLGYGRDDTEGVINIFLEYVSGGSLSSRLSVHGPFDESLTRYITKQICSGLAYLHSRNILHRDIKAANILIEQDGICKISDFGLSKKNDYDEVYDENSRMSLRGSIYWMAPEVVKNEPYSAKVDIWSLGCTVLEMLTGQRPWLALSQIAAIYNLGRLNSPNIPDHISNCAKDFLKQCFIIDPIQRPTATNLLEHEFLNIDPSFQFNEYLEKGKI
ncbi:hypothetical protein RMCBS344292_00663 [Rhizopus microsporus]|nr:hypothetical protein RMCBS344292_00663 [Rhizopus microsporus]